VIDKKIILPQIEINKVGGKIMAKDALELKNGAIITLETGASLENMEVLSKNMTEMIKVWGEMTEENLSEVQVKNGSGVAVGRYAGLLLVSETSIVQTDGSIRTSFRLREKTDMEKRMDAIEGGQTVQDGAIMDLAEIVSTIAEA